MFIMNMYLRLIFSYTLAVRVDMKRILLCYTVFVFYRYIYIFNNRIFH